MVRSGKDLSPAASVSGLVAASVLAMMGRDNQPAADANRLATEKDVSSVKTPELGPGQVEWEEKSPSLVTTEEHESIPGA
jgi:hypothetical protein